MIRHYPLAIATAALALLLPGPAHANARLVSVVPRNGGCVGSPSGHHVETWPVQPGMVYTLRFDHVHECAHDGSDPTIGVLLSGGDAQSLPLTAAKISNGEYEFDYTVPAGACEELHVRYGVTDGRPGTGFEAGRHDDGTEQAHLRACTFSAGCTNPNPILCRSVPTIASTWGQLKSIYR